MRCAVLPPRTWDDYEDNIVNPDGIALADSIIKVSWTCDALLSETWQPAYRCFCACLILFGALCVLTRIHRPLLKRSDGLELCWPAHCVVLCCVQAGLARFPISAHMVLVNINFLSSVQNNQQACNSQLQAARKLQANLCDRWADTHGLLALLACPGPQLQGS